MRDDRPLSELAYDSLKSMILSGRVKPGERLGERERERRRRSHDQDPHRHPRKPILRRMARVEAFMLSGGLRGRGPSASPLAGHRRSRTTGSGVMAGLVPRLSGSLFAVQSARH